MKIPLCTLCWFATVFTGCGEDKVLLVGAERQVSDDSAIGAETGGTVSGSAGIGSGGAGAASGASGAPGTGGASSAGASTGGAGTTAGTSGAPGGTGGDLGASANGGQGAAPPFPPPRPPPGSNGQGGSPPIDLLVFPRTMDYRHDSIPAAIDAIVNLAVDQGWSVRVTEDSTTFTDAKLQDVDVILFLSTSGDVLDDEQQAAFERFIRAGRGFVGLHSAADTERDWAFYGELVGARFREHSGIQPATVAVENPDDPLVQGIPDNWTRTDEWYAFDVNPRANVEVLLTLDESTYSPGTALMGADHPITWRHEYEGGRAFYTALGHTRESYSDPLILGVLTRAIVWAAGR